MIVFLPYRQGILHCSISNIALYILVYFENILVEGEQPTSSFLCIILIPCLVLSNAKLAQIS